MPACELADVLVKIYDVWQGEIESLFEKYTVAYYPLSI